MEEGGRAGVVYTGWEHFFLSWMCKFMCEVRHVGPELQPMNAIRPIGGRGKVVEQ